MQENGNNSLNPIRPAQIKVGYQQQEVYKLRQAEHLSTEWKK